MIVKLCHAAIVAATALSCTVTPANGISSDAISLKLAGVHLLLEGRGALCFIKSIEPGGKEHAYSLEIP
jgi:hypothetical protein